MNLEIERKFLVINANWRKLAEGKFIRQGYLNTEKNRTVRVRSESNRGLITIKGKPEGLARPEFEYEIPYDDAVYLLKHLCHKPLIEKTRYLCSYQDQTWEIDEFHGENAGLIIAEIELTDESIDLQLPDWIGQEITGDPRYYNANLVGHPYNKWQA